MACPWPRGAACVTHCGGTRPGKQRQTSSPRSAARQGADSPQLREAGEPSSPAPSPGCRGRCRGRPEVCGGTGVPSRRPCRSPGPGAAREACAEGTAQLWVSECETGRGGTLQTGRRNIWNGSWVVRRSASGGSERSPSRPVAAACPSAGRSSALCTEREGFSSAGIKIF